MQPRSHQRILEASLCDAARPWLEDHRSRIVAGNDDEDTVTLGMFGRSLRLPSLGLSHTYQPGSRFGELWAPSARRRCDKFVHRATAARASDPKRAAWWLGRACHLIVDAAVPARTQRIWHVAGDPLESFIDEHVERLALLPRTEARCSTSGEVMEVLARIAVDLPVGTTGSPWGAAGYRAFGWGTLLSQAELERQARALVPIAIAHLAAFLASFADL
jgi:hypothetical protein